MRKRPLCLICVLFLVIQAARVCFIGAETREVSALEKVLDTGCAVTVKGTVSGIEEKEKVTAFFLKDAAVSLSCQKFREPNLMVYVRPDQTEKEKKEDHLKESGVGVRLGNQVQISGEASLFDEARNPGNFDQRAYYARQDIHMLVWADDMKLLSDETYRVREFLSRVRSSWKELLIKHLGEYYGGTMSAVLLGEKSGLDDEMKKLYQKNGIGHLLAISGLHMSFIGMGIYSLLRKTGLGFILAGCMGGAVLILYTLMIGAGVSSLRALIMFLVRIGADVTGRDYDLPTSLSISAAILCARQPLYLTDAGFLLSFGAILGIILLGPVFEEMTGSAGTKSRILKSILGSLAVSLAVNVMLLGPVLYFYFEVPPYSVLLNLLVIPLMPVAMGAGVIGSAAAVVWELPGSVVLKLCKAVLWGYDSVCSAASALPGSRFVSGRPGLAWLIAYYAVLGLLCIIFCFLKQRQEQREERGTEDERKDSVRLFLRVPGGCLLIFAVFMAVFCRMGYHAGDGVQVTVLDVGQGDSIHIRGESGEYLVDGGSSDVSSVGTYRIEPYLLSNAADTLNYVFVTHGDEDHISGIVELLEGQKLGVHIKTLVLPPEEYCEEKLLGLTRTAEKNGTRVVTMSAGDALEEGITCLGPEKGAGISPGNEASLVLSLTYGNFDMLLTGDVEGKGEDALVESGRLRKYDVLKAAHHGSKNSSLEPFLETVKPSVTLISAGVDNRYGHPHEETLKRLEAAGSRVYSTQENGAVRIWTDGENMKIQGGRLWEEQTQR